MENTFEEKLNKLYDEATSIISDLIAKNGVKSEHTSNLCLKITDDSLMFNLENRRYLTEVRIDGLVDNSGYSYDVSVLDADNFFEVVDHLIKEYSN